jgi:glutamate carboxypeptidase
VGGACGGADPGRGNGCGTGTCSYPTAQSPRGGDPVRSDAATINGNSMTPIIRLRDFCRSEGAWLRETVEALVRIESPSTDKTAVDRCGAELARRLAAIGGRVTKLSRTDRGDHLRAEFSVGPANAGRHEKARGEEARQVLLLGHFDTVWPIGQLERMPIVESDGRLHGPGIFDMKGGIAVGMLAMRALLATGVSQHRRVVMLWTSDEEIGSGTSRAAIEDEARKSDAVLVLEPSLPGGALKTARKGCGGYEIVVRGISAHAGIEPQKGASAVQELAHQILRINALQDVTRGVTANVVQVSGGVRSNVIPDEARAIVDVRAPTLAAMSELEAAIGALTPVDRRTTIEVHGGFDRPPLERRDAVVRLFELARGVARALGHDLEEGATGGGSDGNFTAALGVPTLDGLGPIGDGAHALHEHVTVDALPDRAALIAGLIQSIVNS